MRRSKTVITIALPEDALNELLEVAGSLELDNQRFPLAVPRNADEDDDEDDDDADDDDDDDDDDDEEDDKAEKEKEKE
jgi:hypothetical protein